MAFTKRKFDSLPDKQRHKKAAECLRNHLEGREEKLVSYLELHKWLHLPPLPAHPTTKELADLYHFHAHRGEITHREPHLLSLVQRQDRPFPRAPSLPIHLYLDNLRSAHNVGSILRTWEAFHLGKIYHSPTTPSTSHLQVRATSMGSWQWVEMEVVEKIEELPSPLILLETVEEAPALSEVALPASFTLVLGNEEYGCSDILLSAADQIVTIPLYGRKNSLNVANALAIAAHLIRHQFG